MQQRHDVIRLRVAPEHGLREDEVAGDVNVEDAVRARHHFNRRDERFELLENPRCQTDSVWPRASGDAVLNANRGRIGHASSLSPPAVNAAVALSAVPVVGCGAGA